MEKKNKQKTNMTDRIKNNNQAKEICKTKVTFFSNVNLKKKKRFIIYYKIKLFYVHQKQNNKTKKKLYFKL